jgi:hypothetical protein
MPNQIIDQHGATADPQRIAYEVYQLGWIKVVRKQIAADQVKGCIAEREGERIGDYGSRPGGQMRGSAVKQGKVEHNTSSRQTLRRGPGSFPKSGGDLQQR